MTRWTKEQYKQVTEVFGHSTSHGSTLLPEDVQKIRDHVHMSIVVFIKQQLGLKILPEHITVTENFDIKDPMLMHFFGKWYPPVGEVEIYGGAWDGLIEHWDTPTSRKGYEIISWNPDTSHYCASEVSK